MNKGGCGQLPRQTMCVHTEAIACCFGTSKATGNRCVLNADRERVRPDCEFNRHLRALFDAIHKKAGI